MEKLRFKIHQIIFEATAQIENDGSHARIDILRKSDGKDGWDLIEVKGSMMWLHFSGQIFNNY